MKIRMLGTGYGECKIKRFSSKDFRRRGGVLIDELILIDAPSDIFELESDLGFSDLYNKVGVVLISHSHPGHFDPEAVLKLARRQRIFVFADKETLALIPESDRIERVALMPFSPIEIDGYRILPLPANHATDNPKERCLNFIVSKDRTLFYALDGGFINSDAWRVLKELYLDAVIMDTAAELAPPSDKLLYHSGYSMNCAIRGILLSAKVAGDNTRFILSHIPSPRRRSVHEELSALAKEEGLTVAYDGYYLNI